jgi:hypothetical protein
VKLIENISDIKRKLKFNIPGSEYIQLKVL